MPRPKFQADLNMNDAGLKRQFMAFIGGLSGLYEVDVRPRRPLRSSAQHRYYFAAVVRPFADWLGEQEGGIDSGEAAHEALKKMFLSATVRHPETGRKIGTVTRSTGSLTTEEMTNYIESCRAWLLDFCGVVTMDPQQAGCHCPEPTSGRRVPAESR